MARRHACTERSTVEDSAMIIAPDLEGDEGPVAVRNGVRESNDTFQSHRTGGNPENHVRPCVHPNGESVGRPTHGSRIAVSSRSKMRRIEAAIDRAHLRLGEGQPLQVRPRRSRPQSPRSRVQIQRKSYGFGSRDGSPEQPIQPPYAGSLVTDGPRPHSAREEVADRGVKILAWREEDGRIVEHAFDSHDRHRVRTSFFG